MNDTSLPLWRQLHAAADVLVSIRAGASATAALATVPSDLRPGVQALVFQSLRWLGRAEALRRHLAPRTPAPQVDALLIIALALCWREEDAPYESFTLVNQTVEAAKRSPVTRMQSGFINAVLRRFLRERGALIAATDGEPLARWNHPRWWIDRLRRDWPQDWQDILEADNRQPPLTLRVNARKSDRDAWLAHLRAGGIAGKPVGDYGIQLETPRPVQQIPGFNEGIVSVQDAAAQMAAPLLAAELESLTPNNARPRILDACAAPGGKTAHLLEIADAEVTALEIDPTRAARIGDTLRRLGLAAHVLTADASRPSLWWNGELYDAILLDAPCSASGIVRRHPDVRWLRRESDITQLAIVQGNLLASLWPLLAPGGRLLYCTCSVFVSEGEAAVQTFVAHNKDAAILPSPGHLKPQSGANADAVRDNGLGEHDGFYYALLGKKAP